MAVYIAGKIITYTIGKHLVSKAIVDSSQNIYGTISSIYYYSADIEAIIRDLDIKQRLETIEKVCNTLCEYDDKANIVEGCLESIHDVILEIKADLKNINAKLAKHKRKYFNSWRSVNVKKYLKSLRLHSCILDKRYNLLINSMRVLNN